jgi:hypothetical protein
MVIVTQTVGIAPKPQSQAVTAWPSSCTGMVNSRRWNQRPHSIDWKAMAISSMAGMAAALNQNSVCGSSMASLASSPVSPSMKIWTSVASSTAAGATATSARPCFLMASALA